MSEEHGLGPERNAEVVRLRDEGATWTEIGEKFGVTRQQVRYAYQVGKRADRRRTRER